MVMLQRFFSTTSLPPLAGALLLATGCLTGVDVGNEGSGGSAGHASTGTGTGAPVPPATGLNCKSPATLLCSWGVTGGPCTGSSPNQQECGPGGACVGATADAPGTCGGADGTVAAPRDACGAGVPSTPVCPWNYTCDAPIQPDGVGKCVPRACVLDDIALTSEASITVDGDGPTQRFDFGSRARWGSQFTGEAVGFATQSGSGTFDHLQIWGVVNAFGEELDGNVFLTIPLTGVGTVHEGGVEYLPAGAYAAGIGNYLGGGGGPTQATFTITEITADRIRGTFSDVLVTRGFNGSGPIDPKTLSGTFDVCRLPDHYPQ
jgi:hypothetical protein